MVNDVLGVLMHRHRYLPAFSRLEAMPRPSPMKSCWRTKSQLDSFKVLFCIAEFEFCSFGRCSHGETLWSQDPSTKEFYDVFRFLISQLELQSRDLWDAWKWFVKLWLRACCFKACKLCQEMTIRFFSLILITVDGLNNTSHNFVGFLIDFCAQYPTFPSRILNWKLRGRWRMRLLVAGWSDVWGATVFVVDRIDEVVSLFSDKQSCLW